MEKEKTLEQLENDHWKDMKIYPSKHIERCHSYRKIPLKNLTIEELRLLIGQEIGLVFLLPLAFEHLEKDILAEGDFYEGDLLKAVLQIKKEFWAEHEVLFKQIENIIEAVPSLRSG